MERHIAQPTIQFAAVDLPPRVLFNPRESSFRLDPYSHYKRLREADPVYYSTMGVWFLARYEDVSAALRDRRLAAQDIPSQVQKKSEFLRTRTISAERPSNLDALVANSRNWFVFKDPPDHTRLRRTVAKAFQRRSVETMRPHVRACAQSLLARMKSNARMDLVKDFSAHLPVNVIATLFGFPSADFEKLAGWAERLPRIFDPLVSFEELETLDRASREFKAYLSDICAEKRARPQPDLLSTLVAARDEQGQLSDDELMSTCIMTFSAGEESTAAMLGNGSLALIRDRDRTHELRAHPDLLPQAVEELMRYDGPLQMTCRTANEDLEIGGKLIRKGQAIYLLLGSANRDPARFPKPDALDWHRPRVEHIAFGAGHHACVGATLARVELEEAFRVLLEILPDLELAGEPRWRDHLVIRGMTSLPVERRKPRLDEKNSIS
jgi:pimeloyl-[acyl-carrier protein] synthase